MRRARVVDLASGSEEVSGADVVVVQENDSDKWAAEIRDRAPNSVVVVIGSPQGFCEGTLFPRARIIGVASADDAAVVVDAVVNDLDKDVDAVVRCEGERGIDGDFARVPVRVGAGGIREIREN